MKRLLFVASLFFISSGDLIAQDPVIVFNSRRENLPAEHIYLHFDKQAYVPGETIWFKAYLYTPGVANRMSTNLYAELLNENGEILQSKKLAVLENKSIAAQFEIPSGIQQGVYFVRAWTNYTKYFDHSFVFKKAIPVLNPSNAAVSTEQNKGGYNFEWFPESGKLVNGVDNVIAFRCTDKQMQPVIVSGTLLNSKGEDLGSFSTNKNGLGYFNYAPVRGEKYFAELQFPDRTKQKNELPVASDNGVVLSVTEGEKEKQFTIFTSPVAANAPKEVLLLAIMNDEIVLNAKIPIKDNEASGIVNTENLREGILQVMVFDNNYNLLAQRASFVTNNQNGVPVELKTSAKTPAPKNLYNLSLILPANTKGNFSVSITDADKELLNIPDHNLKSSVLLQAGSTHPILFPGLTDNEMKDLILLTGSRSNSDWSLFAKKKISKLNEELHLPLQGKLFEQGTSKLITSGQLNFLVKTKDSTAREYNVPVMSDGSFKLFDLTFEDTARIYYRWRGEKNEKAIGTDIELEKENADYTALLKNISAESFIALKRPILDQSAKGSLAAEIIKEVESENSFQNKFLVKAPKAVEIKNEGKQKDANKRYTSGAFASNANARVIDLIAEPPSNISGNIFDYITGRLSGVQVEKTGGSYALFTGRSISTGDALQDGNRTPVLNAGGASRTPQDLKQVGRIEGKTYLDETEVTPDIIARITVDQIALVKYYPPGSIMLPGIGLSGVLAVYTKKPEDLNNSDKRYFNSVIFPGYTAAKQFYLPDYSIEDKKRADNRNTIYWNPDVNLKEGNVINISFYNTDKAKRLRVVLEGITTDGKLVSFEKIIE